MHGAYAHLNLRTNPFGELTANERALVAVADTEPLVAALREPGTAIQIVGHCGRGKSSHMHALRRALPEADYARLWTRKPVPAELSASILLIDEADAVWIWRRLSLLRRATSVAIAVHKDQSWQLRALGFRVLTLHVGETDRSKLRAIVHRRIEHARLGPGPLPQVTDHALDVLISRHGNDVRAMEGHLFEAVYQMTGVGDVQV